MLTSHQQQFVVDCEYSQETRELISMAIVPLWLPHGAIEAVAVPEFEFYEVIAPLPKDMSEWVKVNVVPHLNKTGIPFKQFQERLQDFLRTHRIQELHYDWCEDIAYFNQAMITGPGKRLKLPHEIYGDSVQGFLAHVHHPNLIVRPDIPHNALSDARAIAEAIRRRLYLLP